jgi:hypothetical protein
METQTDTQTLDQFITTAGLTMTANRRDSNPNMPNWEDARHWTCTIQKPRPSDAIHYELYKFSIPFSQGSAHKDEPKLEDVLNCLASDASGYDNARSFEDWCNEYDYDTDSRESEATYNAVKEQSEELKSFLGDSDYATLLWNTERL